MPGVVSGTHVLDVNKGSPSWGGGFFEEPHVRLGWGAVAFEGIAADTGADDVVPGGFSALVTGYDVIEVEFVGMELLPTILACVIVALK